MLDALQLLLPEAVSTHHLGLFRESTTLSPVEYVSLHFPIRYISSFNPYPRLTSTSNQILQQPSLPHQILPHLPQTPHHSHPPRPHNSHMWNLQRRHPNPPRMGRVPRRRHQRARFGHRDTQRGDTEWGGEGGDLGWGR